MSPKLAKFPTSRETFRSNLHLHLHPLHFPRTVSDAAQLERTWREKKKKKYREVRDAFSIADSNYAMVIMVITVRHISPAINSSYGISRVFTRIPATLRQQHRAVGKQRPRPY